MQDLENIINLKEYHLSDISFQQQCKETLDIDGALVLKDFLNTEAINSIRIDGESKQSLAFYTDKKHNIYLSNKDENFSDTHPRNRHSLYDSSEFKQFLCAVLDEKELYEYADSMSSINIHYASEGQELGWHFDNSSFAITLMIHPPKAGGIFEYVKDVRKDFGFVQRSEFNASSDAHYR